MPHTPPLAVGGCPPPPPAGTTTPHRRTDRRLWVSISSPSALLHPNSFRNRVSHSVVQALLELIAILLPTHLSVSHPGWSAPQLLNTRQSTELLKINPGPTQPPET